MVNRTTTIWGPATLRGFQGSGWFYPIALILMFSVLAGLVPSAILREGLLVAFLGVVTLASAANLVFSRVPPATPDRTFGDFVAIALVVVVLTSVYWFRAAIVVCRRASEPGSCVAGRFGKGSPQRPVRPGPIPSRGLSR